MSHVLLGFNHACPRAKPCCSGAKPCCLSWKEAANTSEPKGTTWELRSDRQGGGGGRRASNNIHLSLRLWWMLLSTQVGQAGLGSKLACFNLHMCFHAMQPTTLGRSVELQGQNAPNLHTRRQICHGQNCYQIIIIIFTDGFKSSGKVSHGWVSMGHFFARIRTKKQACGIQLHV